MYKRLRRYFVDAKCLYYDLSVASIASTCVADCPMADQEVTVQNRPHNAMQDQSQFGQMITLILQLWRREVPGRHHNVVLRVVHRFRHGLGSQGDRLAFALAPK